MGVLGEVGEEQRPEAPALERVGHGEGHLGHGAAWVAHVLGVPDDPLGSPGKGDQAVVVGAAARRHRARGTLQIDRPEEPVALGVGGELPEEGREPLEIAGPHRAHADGRPVAQLDVHHRHHRTPVRRPAGRAVHAGR